MDASLEMMVALIVVLGVITLALIGYLVWGMRKNRKTKARPSKQDVSHAPDEGTLGDFASLTQSGKGLVTDPVALPTQPEESLPSVAAGPVVQRSESASQPKGVVLLQAWQDEDGVMWVEVDGQRYRRLYDIRDGAVGRGVLETINRLVAFSKGQEPRTASPAPSPPPVGVPSPASDTRGEERSDLYLAQLEAETATVARKQRLTVDPVPFRRRNDILQPGITLDLAAEVDNFLQIRVSGSKELEGRYIHVTSSPDGSLRFHVDGTRYDALEVIPDGQVQAVMRAAITDWEAKR